MIRYGANGVGATYTRAWILASIANARLAHWTIGVAGTFGSAAFVWIAVIFAGALAHSMIIFDATTCIISAWRRNAWILGIARNIYGNWED